VNVAVEDALLQRANEQLKELEIHLVQAHLLHVDVPGGHRLVTALQPVVGVATIGPAVVRLHNGHQIVAERVRHNLEPEDIRTRLRYLVAAVQLERVVRVYVLLGPIQPVAEQRMEVRTCHRTIEVIGVDQVSE